MVAVQEMLKQVSDRVETSASARAIFGEPVTQGNKTVIPVARVRYSYGAGGGSGEAPDPAHGDRNGAKAAMAKGSGGGGGAMVNVTPVGYIEITLEATRFVSVEEKEKLMRMAFWGSLVAMFLFMRHAGKIAKRRRR